MSPIEIRTDDMSHRCIPVRLTVSVGSADRLRKDGTGMSSKIDETELLRRSFGGLAGVSGLS